MVTLRAPLPSPPSGDWLITILKAFTDSINTRLGLTSECYLPTWEHPPSPLVALSELQRVSSTQEKDLSMGGSGQGALS